MIERSNNRISNPLVAVNFLLFLLMSTSGTVVAQQSEEELAKQSQNPIASIISLPFQNKPNRWIFIREHSYPMSVCSSYVFPL